MNIFLRQYGAGTGADIIIPILKAGSTDFAVSGDWTPAAGDVKISKDGGTAVNIGTLPTFVTDAGWLFVFTDAELQAGRINVNIVDSATKAIVDTHIIIETYGNASAQHSLSTFDPTDQLTESYAADGAAPTTAQALFGILQFLTERNVSGTTVTIKKLDGSTTAMTLTLDDSADPTSMTRTG